MRKQQRRYVKRDDRPSPSESSTYQCQKTIRKAAIKMLARREYSALELLDKLSEYYHVDAINDVIVDLQCNDWQSEERFAEMWVRSRANRGYGPRRIQQELKQKGLGVALIVEALSAYERNEQHWSDLAEAVYLKKYGATQAESWKDEVKRHKFMQYRGFSHTQFTS